MFENSMKAGVAALALALLVFACDSGTKTKTPGKTASSTKAIAVVNGVDITEDDVRAATGELTPYQMNALESEKTRTDFLDTLVTKKLVAQEAEKKGLDKDPELVKALDQTKDELLWRLFLRNEVVNKVKVADADVKAYFDQMKQDLGSVRISHILVGTEAEAEQVLAKLKAGEKFEKLAKAYSLDVRTKNSGGDIGFVKWAQIGSPSLKDAAFRLKPGQVSGVVQSQAGFHVLKVTDKKPASDSEFEPMKEQLKEELAAKKKKELFESVVKGLKDKSKVTTDKDALKAMSFAKTSATGPNEEK